MRPLHILPAAVLALAVSGVATGAAASTLRITFENLAPAGGPSFTPVYTAFTNGTVDLFNVGDAASAGVEELAELGSFGGVAGERVGQQADSQGVPGLTQAANGVPTIDAGESVSANVVVGDKVTNQNFIFFSMVVSSNDTFIGTDDPAAFQLFDDSGVFLGPLEISIGFSENNIFDAGTEVNDFSEAGGPAFAVGIDANNGVDEGGTVQLTSGLGLLSDIQTPAGTFTTAGAALVNTPGVTLARITISEVPLPAPVFLLLGGLATLGFMRRRA